MKKNTKSTSNWNWTKRKKSPEEIKIDVVKWLFNNFLIDIKCSSVLVFFWWSVTSARGFLSPTNEIYCHLSIFPYFSFPPFSYTVPAPVTISFVLLPNQSFSFRPELISPSPIVDAILQSAFTTSSSPMLLHLFDLFLLFYLILSIYPHSAFLWYSLQMGLHCSRLVLGNLCRDVEQCLDWMWLAMLSVLCCRIGAMRKTLCWQPVVYYHHGTDIQYYKDRLPISQEGCVAVYWCTAFFFLSLKYLNFLYTNYSIFASIIKVNIWIPCILTAAVL